MPRYGYGRYYRGARFNLYTLIDIAIIAGMIYILISLLFMAAAYIIALIALLLARWLLRGRLPMGRIWY